MCVSDVEVVGVGVVWCVSDVGVVWCVSDVVCVYVVWMDKHVSLMYR